MISARQAAMIAAAALFAAALRVGPRAWAAEAGGDAPRDSSAVFEWGWVYRAATVLVRDSDPFPWNDPLAEVHLNDRVTATASWRSAGGFALFLKGAGGACGAVSAVEGANSADAVEQMPGIDAGFEFEQGHLAYESNRFHARLFSRERVFRSANRLLPLVSNDSPLVSRGGEGLDLFIAGPLGVSYTGAVVGRAAGGGGFPVPGGGGEYFNLFELDLERGRWHAGLVLADTRSREGGDAVMFGLGFGIPVGGAVCIAEYALSEAGAWDDFSRRRLLAFETERMKTGRVSDGISPAAALQVEIIGLEIAAERLGSLGLVPGYRHVGEGFLNRHGEVPPGVIESYLSGWWRHPALAVMLTAEAADRFDAASGESGGVLAAALHARLKGGLEVREAALFRAGRRPFLVCSLIDENALTRFAATARVDDAGGNNEFSYLAEAMINLGRGLTLGGTLLLERSRRGFYSVDLEMRQGRRFLARAAFGSYVPFSESVMLSYGPSAPGVVGERFVSLFTRVSFGGI